MAVFVVATIKSWNLAYAEKLKEKYPQHEFIIVSSKEQLKELPLEDIQPKYIFFPHWSWIIPETIHTKYSCDVFHMTDLPFGRGGSPLQNLLLRGIYQTKISAIRVAKELDGGEIYLKEDLDISTGSADDILKRAAKIVFEKMIPAFIEKKLNALPQQGKPVFFNRRKPEQSCIPFGLSSRQLYDYIRMLDGEGYPTAYLQTEHGKVYLRNASFQNGKVMAELEYEEIR